MNAPARFLELAQTAAHDRDKLAALEADLTDLRTKVAQVTALRDEYAENVNVMDAMLSHAQRTFELTIPAPAPDNGVPPQPPSIFGEVLREHPEMQHTAPHPVVNGNGADVTVPDPEQPAGKPVAQRGGRRG